MKMWKVYRQTERRQVTSLGELKTHFDDFFLLIYSFCKIFSRAATLLSSNWSFSLSKSILSLCIALNSALYSTTHVGSACTLLLLGGFNDGRSEDFPVSLFFQLAWTQQHWWVWQYRQYRAKTVPLPVRPFLSLMVLYLINKES